MGDTFSGPVISISFSFGPNAPSIWSVRMWEGSRILAFNDLSEANPEITEPSRNLNFSMSVGNIHEH